MSPKLRVFSAEDQLAFARLSGDYNPIHLDPVVARRLLFGQPVVHGMHALLWAVDGLLAQTEAKVRLKAVKARFRSSIPLDVPVELQVNHKSPTDAALELRSEGAKVLTANVSLELTTGRETPIPREVPASGPCRDQSPAELPSASGRVLLCLEPEIAKRLFPNAFRLLPADQLATLLATTRVVGMEAPGLHSILAGLDLHDCGSTASEDLPELRYATESFDERISRLELRLEAPGLAGMVTAFVRPEPRRQSAFAAIRLLVGPDEFRHEKALVIGGSRGLGEVAVKLLTAGGADVRFTYHRGAAEAERLTSEIAGEGGSVASFPYDVLCNGSQLAAGVQGWSPTLLCYFATPFIATGVERRFRVPRFQNFCRYYLDGFLEAFEAVRQLGSLSGVFNPSSSFVDELPLNMGEYAAAKSAAETLCRYLEKTHGGIRFHCPRLPRLATDQTASLIRTDLPDPAPTLLAALRESVTK